MKKEIQKHLAYLSKEMESLPLDKCIDLLNEIRLFLHNKSPFKNEPVDNIVWVKCDDVGANDYNPNTVAPPEMKLLEHSIQEDGYTQPVVTWNNDNKIEVIDGFHRTRVGKESEVIRKRIYGYLPITIVNSSRTDRGDRIASTIRHNRARGKHQVTSMSDIVVELARRNWSNERISKDLGMDEDEVLRLKQVKGLAEVFKDKDFNEAWEHSGEIDSKNISDEDAEDMNLEWMNDLDVIKYQKGWSDRTEISSVLCNDQSKMLGMIQKSRFKDEWFWYCYSQPMEDGVAKTKDEAMKIVNKKMNYEATIL